jgi:hypothetical protein
MEQIICDADLDYLGRMILNVSVTASGKVHIGVIKDESAGILYRSGFESQFFTDTYTWQDT